MTPAPSRTRFQSVSLTSVSFARFHHVMEWTCNGAVKAPASPARCRRAKARRLERQGQQSQRILSATAKLARSFRHFGDAKPIASGSSAPGPGVLKQRLVHFGE